MSFLNPALLSFGLLFAVPLVIHLLNRQRYKRRPWAAMEFLLAAYRKQRRRLRTENLLLLLLRCLIPIVLALAIARPILRDSIAAPLVGGSAHHVLVLDHSYSMALRPPDAQSPFARMRDLAGELLEGLEGQNGHKVTLVMAGVRTEMPVLADLDLGQAKAVVASLEGPQDSASDLTEALDQVAELVEEPSADDEERVYLFTDLQAHAFGAAAAPVDDGAAAPVDPDEAAEAVDPADFADTARDLFDRVQQHADVVLVDVGGIANDAAPAQADNLQVADIALDGDIAIARTPVPVLVTVRNHSPTAQLAQVTLEVDGGQPQRRTAEVEAGAEQQLEFSVTFHTTGRRTLRASLDQDGGLLVDNDRFAVVSVRERIRVLMVEGSGEADPGLRETELLRSLLDPTRGEGPPGLTTFDPVVLDTVSFLALREDPTQFDLVVLANVERLNEAAATALEEAVAAGTGLWVMLGDRVDAASYNLHLAERTMPVRLTAPTGYLPGGDRFYESVIEAPDHPVFQGFPQEVYAEVFQRTPIYRFYGTTGELADGAEVLARIRDRDRTPLVIASRIGAGKALWWTSPLSLRPDRWNRFELPMLALPLSHESARWLTVPTIDPYNVTVGAELTAALRQRPTETYVVLSARGGGRRLVVGGAARPMSGGRWGLPPFRETRFAGFYTVETRLEIGGGQRDERIPFAVNVDPAEGELVYLSHTVARERLGVPTILRRLPADRSGNIQAGASDFGQPLLWLGLLVVLGEASLARFVTRRRSA